MNTQFQEILKRGMLSTLIVAVLVQSVAPLAQADEAVTANSAEAERRAYIQNAPDDLYDQSKRLADPEFLSLPIPEQDDILINDFKDKKYSYLDSQLRTAYFKSALLAAIAAGLVVGTYNYDYFQRQYFLSMEQLNSADSTERAKGFGRFVIGYVGALVGLVGFFESPRIIVNTVSSTWTAYDNRYTNRFEDPMLPFEVAYMAKKRFLDKNIAKVVEDSFKASRMSDANVRFTMETVNVALNLPTESKPIQYDKKRMNKSLADYDDMIQNQAKSFILQQVLLQNHNSISEDFTIAGPREGKRIVAFLNGPPGSGKTRLAAEIAKVLKIPFGQVSLEGATLADLQGTALTSNSPSPGKILQAMAKAKYEGDGAKNMVLFIDEADRIINGKTAQSADILPFLLKLLDSENKTFYNPFFNTDIDVSNLIIILAGNHEIEDEALSKRLFTFWVGGFPTDVKRRIIWDQWIPTALKNYSQNGQYIVKTTDLNDEDKSKINALITLDKDPGFRTLEKVLSEYITFVAERKYFDAEAVSPPHLKSIVEKSNKKLAEKAARQ